MQVLKGLQLKLVSLEASRIWWLRLGLEFAARQRDPTGDQVANLIGYITWSLLLRRPELSLVNARYRFARTFGPRSGWVSLDSDGLLRCCRCSIVALPVHGPLGFTCATDASGGTRGGSGVARRRCDLRQCCGWPVC